MGHLFTKVNRRFEKLEPTRRLDGKTVDLTGWGQAVSRRKR
jgi:hypothetical protein